ncbi:hypothetical protein C1646_466966 [Rhizophagus diaphanus]|nr:hypothetical protein C1646_466966 [Rhizophagus diaphanus] [Rhizophagus sp. MUCL 43196]
MSSNVDVTFDVFIFRMYYAIDPIYIYFACINKKIFFLFFTCLFIWVMQFARRIKFSSAIKGHFLLLHTLLVYRFLKIWINRMLLSLLSGIRNLTYSILKKF